MALWLWVTDLDPKNDWIELKSFSLGSPASSGGGSTGKLSMNDAHLSLDPGRFRMDLYNWVIRGKQKTAYVFFDPQTEYKFLNALATGMSMSGHDGIMSLSINYEKLTVDYSGAP